MLDVQASGTETNALQTAMETVSLGPGRMTESEYACALTAELLRDAKCGKYRARFIPEAAKGRFLLMVAQPEH